MLEPSSSEEEDEDYLQEQNGYGQVINVEENNKNTANSCD